MYRYTRLARLKVLDTNFNYHNNVTAGVCVKYNGLVKRSIGSTMVLVLRAFVEYIGHQKFREA